MILHMVMSVCACQLEENHFQKEQVKIVQECFGERKMELIVLCVLESSVNSTDCVACLA